MTSTSLNISIDPNQISVSGISAGAFMAHQLHIAFSDIFCGAGLIAGGPYMSANHSLNGALLHGLHGFPPPNPRQLVQSTQALATLQHIADTKHLQNSKVWLFHGTQDTVVNQSVSDALAQYYTYFVPEQQVKYIKDIQVVHAMPTDTFGPTNVTEAAAPYLVNCGFDAAGALLSHIHGPLNPKIPAIADNLIPFNQQKFLTSKPGSSMDTVGFMYVPTSAKFGQPCGLHVALHGCMQHREALGEVFAMHAGYNEWAEANNLIVMYPQAVATKSFAPFNPAGSWDWWGYTGPNYAVRSSVQMGAIVKMIDLLVP